MIIFLFLHLSLSTFAAKPLGMDSCPYGAKGCNTCVNNVRNAFAKIGATKELRHDFFINRFGSGLNIFERFPWRPLKDHVQSVTRVPGLGSQNWLALTRNSSFNGGGGLFLVPFRGIESDGGPWKHARRRSSDMTDEFYFYPIKEANHIGGIQALGSLVFVANECSTGCEGRVDIIDVSNPKAPQTISSVEVAKGSEAKAYSRETLFSKASSVAATRLSDGSYLMYVGGRKSGRYGWFYRSEKNDLHHWNYQNRFHILEKKGLKWGEWENSALVTECSTKDIYYITMGERKSRTNLYLVTQDQGEFDFKYVDSKHLDGSNFNTFTLGGGLHITPEHELLMYSSTRFGKRINEFRFD